MPFYNKMDLAIVGSRNFVDQHIFENFVQQVLDKWGLQPKKIISGGANGADQLAKKYALAHGIELVEFLPQWNKYGRSAGPIRNREIIKAATHLIAFPSHHGVGTQHTINFAKEKEIPMEILYVDS